MRRVAAFFRQRPLTTNNWGFCISLDVSTVLEHWCFPLFDVDLRRGQVTTQELKEVRNSLIEWEFGD